ncbi:phosphoglycerate mutase-like protein [Myriangium duriaei CBS 260.36]|uniref:Phosphoglycerate mutase-like protein n=1 Tax=Myriangium duriaei CBS 260.36 TaxID=1168546 RepID=A0A9P4ISV9_9PEZI|nr:phosphoglycerate mutase-like protein [Myriangium duriaei CBS 260.36]
MVSFTLTALTAFSLYTLSGATTHSPTPVSGPSAATFSVPTASTANPTASGITVDHGKAYIKYTTVTGFFLQDLNTTNQTGFDYATVNFGLLNRTYPDETPSDCRLPQWGRFDKYLTRLNRYADRNTHYKLLFIGRHGEGYHNAAETFYGTPAWNCYWSEQPGNSTNSWSDARLTPNGIAQASKANAYWARLQTEQRITTPQSFYVSPLTRCLQTANTTFASLSLPKKYPFHPTVKEFLRESISIHTCDRRSSRSYIQSLFPSWSIDPTLTQSDELWSGITAETNSAQDYRSTIVLDDIFSSDRNRVISLTTHSGETGSLLRVLGHRAFSLGTGQIIPVLVKAETVKSAPALTTTAPWTAGAWCTAGPPVTSGAAGCTCAGGVSPTEGTASSTPTA